MVFLEIAALIVTIIVSILTVLKWKFLYWQNKNIPYLKPKMPFGTYENPFNPSKCSAIVVQEQYHHLKSLGCKYGGLYSFTKPIFLLVDRDIIKDVLSKDFQYFTDRGLYYNEKDDPLSANLFKLEGERWRNLRAKLTPTFTTGKIKKMFPTLVACGDPLHTAITELNQNKLPLDVKDIVARFTTDVIGSCAFGIECNSFAESEGEFRKYGRRLLAAPTNQDIFKYLIVALSPSLSKLLNFKKRNAQARTFFINIVKETVAYRQKNNIERNDFMQLVMKLMNDNDNGVGLTIEQVAAQAFAFFLAGFETSSTTMTFCLYELAINQRLQDRVRAEIRKILLKYNGNITYDAVMEMKFLDNVIDETLRKYPPLALLPRVCTQDYQIPDTNSVIEKGTPVVIPVYALQHDPEYYANPEKYDPDRFNDENKDSILPFTFMPFGEGPRICIGLRFGLLQTKVGLIILLRNMKYTLNPKTKYPMEFHRTSYVLSANGGIWLDSTKIS